MQSITLRAPDDFHIHLRQDDLLVFTLKHAAKNFQRILVMPNISPPLTNVSKVKKYYSDIQNILLENNLHVECLMTLYLTENTTIHDIIEAKESGIIYACKLYPKNGTTNSHGGVDMKNIVSLFPVFQKMSELSLILCIHGEVTNDDIDIFDRENKFIDSILPNIVTTFPELKIVLEHITTKESVEYVEKSNSNLAATITPQHLLCNRNDIFHGGIRPHYYCLPILKRNEDQQALIKAATSGNEKFFIGTDSAPHTKSRKESDCGCAGCFTGYNPIELYIEAFYNFGNLDNIEKFTSINGAKFYNLPICEEFVTYEKRNTQIPESFSIESGECIVPFLSGKYTKYMRKLQ